MLSQSNLQLKPVSLYSAVVTIICITLITLMLKRCSEPQIATSEMQRLVDSVAFREHLAEVHVDRLSVVIADQDSIIQDLQKRKGVTRTIYRDQVRVVKESLTAAPPECDSLKVAVNNLMDLASEYEAQSDSIINGYEVTSLAKDSIIMLKDKLYGEMKQSFMQAVMAADKNEALAIKYKKRSKRERLLFAGVALASGFFLLQK